MTGGRYGQGRDDVRERLDGGDEEGADPHGDPVRALRNEVAVLSFRLSLAKARDLTSLSRAIAIGLGDVVHIDLGTLEIWQGTFDEGPEPECDDDPCIARFDFIPGREDPVEEVIWTGMEGGGLEPEGYLPAQVRVRTAGGNIVPLFVRSSMVVPLESKGRSVGVLTLHSERQKVRPVLEGIDLMGIWSDLGDCIARSGAEAELIREVKRMGRLDEAVPGPRIIWHGDGSLWEVDMNGSAESFFSSGQGMEKLAEGPFLPMTENDTARALRAWTEVIEGGQEQSLELSLLRQDGGADHVLCTFSSLPMEDGSRGVAMTCIGSNALEGMMRDILEANRSYRLAISIVSHDLKNPLTAIRGYSDLLVEELSGRGRDRSWEMSRKIADLAKRMSDTIGMARTLVQIREGKVRKEYSRMDLATMLRECLEQLDGASHHIQLMTGEGDHQITCHPLLRQTFLNLLDNAIKYSPPGSGIKVDMTANLEGTIVSISDEGEGVPAELREAIFERFSRATRSASIKGSGLGLAIARGIVDLHDGRIWVEENSPRGAVFRVFLPWEPH